MAFQLASHDIFSPQKASSDGCIMHSSFYPNYVPSVHMVTRQEINIDPDNKQLSDLFGGM